MKILILACALHLKTNKQRLLTSRLVEGDVLFKTWPHRFTCVREDLGTNYLKVVTDFSQQDLGQHKTRIAAAFVMN